MTTVKSDFDFIVDAIAPALGISPEQLKDEVYRHHAKRLGKIRASNARYSKALEHLTPKQTDIITKRESDGWKMNKVWQNKCSGLTAVMLVKYPAWDSSKNRLGKKLAMVYPDGTMAETFERTITVRSEF